MKVLITGGSGFIGSNYILQNINDFEILNYDNLTYAGRNNNLNKIQDNPNYIFTKGDICDFNYLFETINTFQPNAIIHFAAESHVDRSIDNPISFIKTNIMGTALLLKAALKYWLESKIQFRFIHVSTDEVFGSLEEDDLFNEESQYSPNSPYSASKASSDHLARAWHKTYKFPAIITNCSNNYGPYQFTEKLIPLMIANCIDGKALPVYGDGENIRDWLYVQDHCKAINKVLIGGDIGETYNIGGNNQIRNIEIVKKICAVLDRLKPRRNRQKYEKLISFVKDRPGHDYKYAIDASKIKNQLGWVPKETFDSGLEKTVQWYINNEGWWRSIQNNNYNQERFGI